ncbi:agmatine deiminase family protein [Gilvimarinus algae]|uniref:Agmatine deiminase family protein n=1 Tax=Gilvimarinus algae TaxID=3058037 RepID=A0ABT8TDU2_9GAMM|nr:agmatine deiminase family protein [Gilvimarinus sp. SDUM040014]MDO3382277.1 agmatine deiminase family protein [Gilvimarinus sp. SDUM040014]
MSQATLLPEWADQSAVLLTWPHAQTDWQPLLDDVTRVYQELAAAISGRAKLLIAAPETAHAGIEQALAAVAVTADRYKLFDVASDDTWARDHGPLTVRGTTGLKLLDFTFNGWGNKFSSAQDNQITSTLAAAGAFAVPVESCPLVLEGGAVEIDEEGTLLTTASCLLNKNRNPELSREAIEQELQQRLGVKKINWLDYGYLEGDDTDSHIDTLARLTPGQGLVYVGCDDPADDHYLEFQRMEQQLVGMTNADGQPYHRFRLPWPKAVFGGDGERLPATYANFLIVNGSVLVPVYRDDKDAEALSVIGSAFPGYEVIGIDCLALIEQHGSLHCITMQLPEGVISF